MQRTKVSPSNWETTKASLKKKWYIYYRFYDPEHQEKYPKGKLRVIKGMNEAKTLAERQEIVRALIKLELNELKILGFNAITEKHLTPIDRQSLISPQTPFVKTSKLY